MTTLHVDLVAEKYLKVKAMADSTTNPSIQSPASCRARRIRIISRNTRGYSYRQILVHLKKKVVASYPEENKLFTRGILVIIAEYS